MLFCRKDGLILIQSLWQLVFPRCKSDWPERSPELCGKRSVLKCLPFQKYFSTYSQFYSVSIRFLLCFTHLQTSDYVVWAEISFVFTDMLSIQGWASRGGSCGGGWTHVHGQDSPFLFLAFCQISIFTPRRHVHGKHSKFLFFVQD